MPLTITSIVRIVDVIEKEVEKPPVEFITSASMPRTLGDVVATENHYVNKTFRNVLSIEAFKELIKHSLRVYRLIRLTTRYNNDFVMVTTPIVNYDNMESNFVKKLDDNIAALSNREHYDVISKLKSIFEAREVSVEEHVDEANKQCPFIVYDLEKLFNNNQYNEELLLPVSDWTITVMDLEGQYVYAEKHHLAQHPKFDLRENITSMYRIKCKFFKGTRVLQITEVSLDTTIDPYHKTITVLGV